MVGLGWVDWIWVGLDLVSFNSNIVYTLGLVWMSCTHVGRRFLNKLVFIGWPGIIFNFLSITPHNIHIIINLHTYRSPGYTSFCTPRGKGRPMTSSYLVLLESFFSYELAFHYLLFIDKFYVDNICKTTDNEKKYLQIRILIESIYWRNYVDEKKFQKDTALKINLDIYQRGNE